MANKPNILVILIDDLGFYDLSTHGSKIYETPNIDQLAIESHSFHQAYANYPRCLPSRFAILTASYPVKEFDGNLTRVPDQDNAVKQFGKAGYQTYWVGKWHLPVEGNTPKGYGFQQSFAANTAGGIASHFFPYNTQKLMAPMGEVAPVRDVEQEGKVGDYLTDVLTDKMLTYIKDSDKSKPFFGVLSTYAVHTPLEAKQVDVDRNITQINQFNYSHPEFINEGTGQTKMRQDNPRYAAMVENMDWNIGRILSYLNESGLAENTIIVFTSDHGGLSNSGTNKRQLATSNYPLRAGKGHLYEGGIRVPLLIKWPNKIKPTKDSKNIVLLMDLLPSLLDLGNNTSLKNVAGRSFKGVIAGKEDWSNRTVFFHEQMARPQMTGDSPCTAIRSGNYKLLHYFEQDSYELYDLTSDIGERNNLINTLPDITARLKKELQLWKETNQLLK